MDTLQRLHEEGSIAWSSMNSVEHLSTLKATVGRFFSRHAAPRVRSKNNEEDTRPTQRQKTPQVVDSCSLAVGEEEEDHGESESFDNVWI